VQKNACIPLTTSNRAGQENEDGRPQRWPLTEGPPLPFQPEQRPSLAGSHCTDGPRGVTLNRGLAGATLRAELHGPPPLAHKRFVSGEGLSAGILNSYSKKNIFYYF
jgi:hypothetical protein